MHTLPQLGIGIGWRPELALWIDRHPGLGFVEVVAEEIAPSVPLPRPLEALHQRGVPIIPHGISLSLGGAEALDLDGVHALGELARRVAAPLVSEHIAFVRAGGREAGHLLPLPRSRSALDVVVANVKAAQEHLPVPLALENVASFLEWPDPEMAEADFINEILERTGALLLLDVANLFANSRNNHWDAERFLERIPLERIAYAHIAGGIERQGLYHDTHAHAVWPEVLQLLEEVCARTAIPGVLLERDDAYPSDADLTAEMKTIESAIARGNGRREDCHAHA